MHNSMKTLRLAMALSVILFTAGCLHLPFVPAPGNSELRAARARELKKILVLTPDIEINSLSAGDIKEEMPEWSQLGSGNVTQALKAELERNGCSAILLDPKTRYASTVSDVMDLHRAVMNSIYEHAIYQPGDDQVFPDRVSQFDYTVGSVKNLLAAYHADGMLIIRGEDNISTGGRKALGVISYINPFSQSQTGGMTFLEVTLTDIDGEVLWFMLKWDAGHYDLRDKDESAEFVQETLANYPGGAS